MFMGKKGGAGSARAGQYQVQCLPPQVRTQRILCYTSKSRPLVLYLPWYLTIRKSMSTLSSFFNPHPRTRFH